MEKTNYTLPEFVFIDGNSHQGDTLANRTVLQHVRSYTILEVIAKEDVAKLVLNPEVKRFVFFYMNRWGVGESHMFVLHFTLADDDDLPEIYEKCRAWYCDYMTWEDRNIVDDETAKFN